MLAISNADDAADDPTLTGTMGTMNAARETYRTDVCPCGLHLSRWELADCDVAADPEVTFAAVGDDSGEIEKDIPLSPCRGYVWVLGNTLRSRSKLILECLSGLSSGVRDEIDEFLICSSYQSHFNYHDDLITACLPSRVFAAERHRASTVAETPRITGKICVTYLPFPSMRSLHRLLPSTTDRDTTLCASAAPNTSGFRADEAHGSDTVAGRRASLPSYEAHP
ncbi:hypothetical protein B0H10DRAFT_2214045 [Mycena sp. CBHHK59/15]|nr:hypothetical protein B0H10DRAFT_2214045 [Mycena sp. CBHHK59/15]